MGALLHVVVMLFQTIMFRQEIYGRGNGMFNLIPHRDSTKSSGYKANKHTEITEVQIWSHSKDNNLWN